jgi:preprotein translocase SecE subunit
VYKPGQGMSSRIGAVVLIALFGIYSAHRWYFHFFEANNAVALAGTLILALGFAALAAWTGIYKARTVDFLIEMDAELRKVNWPAVTPVFSPKAEAWGATFVVIITVVIMGVFFYAVDRILAFTIQDGLLPWLFT